MLEELLLVFIYKMKNISKLPILIILFFLSLQHVNGQGLKDKIVDKKDGAVDISEFLNSTTGFLPIPIIITEPAVGFGGGLGLVYFHNKKNKDGEGRGKGLSPTMSFGAGAYTSNDTWFVMGGHSGSYKEDRIRYLGVLGYTSVNLTFYGGVENVPDGEFKFNMKGILTLQELLFRINKKTPFFLGLNYTFFTNTIKFDLGLDLPIIKDLEIETSTAGLNAVFLFDSRDNTFTPTKGLNTTLELGGFAKGLGGDNNFWNLESRTYFYQPLIKEKLFSGFRLHIASKSGDVPFYQLPFISLRGIPALRYQNNNVLTVETEMRWNVFRRWDLVGFVGAGDAMEYYSDYGKNIKVAGGGGFRYLLAKQYGMHVGADVAKGPEQWTWNITVGSNWVR